MLSDLDETLRQLLMAELPVKNGEIEISFHQPKREWSARLTRPTVNLYLYDVRENPALRQHQWERMSEGHPTMSQAHLKRTPFRVDCFYMLTTWAADPEDEHRLLTRCLLALFRNPSLPEARLVGSLKNQPYEIPARLASHDKLTNPADLWSALDNEIRPTVSYILTLALDPWTEITGAMVRTLILRSGPARPYPSGKTLQPADPTSDMVFIGGTVTSKDGQPVAGIDVAVKGSGLFDVSDALGRFTLGGLLPGVYTLVAWPPQGKPVEKNVQVPGSDYDLVITNERP